MGEERRKEKRKETNKQTKKKTHKPGLVWYYKEIVHPAGGHNKNDNDERKK